MLANTAICKRKRDGGRGHDRARSTVSRMNTRQFSYLNDQSSVGVISRSGGSRWTPSPAGDSSRAKFACQFVRGVECIGRHRLSFRRREAWSGAPTSRRPSIHNALQRFLEWRLKQEFSRDHACQRGRVVHAVMAMLTKYRRRSRFFRSRLIDSLWDRIRALRPSVGTLANSAKFPPRHVDAACFRMTWSARRRNRAWARNAARLRRCRCRRAARMSCPEG